MFFVMPINFVAKFEDRLILIQENEFLLISIFCLTVPPSENNNRVTVMHRLHIGFPKRPTANRDVNLDYTLPP